MLSAFNCLFPINLTHSSIIIIIMPGSISAFIMRVMSIIRQNKTDIARAMSEKITLLTLLFAGQEGDATFFAPLDELLVVEKLNFVI